MGTYINTKSSAKIPQAKPSVALMLASTTTAVQPDDSLTNDCFQQHERAAASWQPRPKKAEAEASGDSSMALWNVCSLAGPLPLRRSEHARASDGRGIPALVQSYMYAPYLGGKSPSDDQKWTPNMEAVRATIRFALATGRLDASQPGR
jgi:hypothetical protein